MSLPDKKVSQTGYNQTSRTSVHPVHSKYEIRTPYPIYLDSILYFIGTVYNSCSEQIRDRKRSAIIQSVTFIVKEVLRRISFIS